jgi:hypothetical protein
MPDSFPDLDVDLADLSQQDWLARMDELGDEYGFFEQLGSSHFALFVEAGPKLLVTFESLEGARKHPGAIPRGFDALTRHGWSLLCLFSDGETWFRHPAVYGTFDRLVDDGFFEDFDQVLFAGEGSCGYAAAAFSVSAPGARVLSIRPLATLDPSVAGWDRRHLRDRRRDFTSRYGYAPDMIDAAEQAYVLFDPAHLQDSMHAALFRRPNVTMLRCPQSGTRTELVLDLMQVTPQLYELAMDGQLNRVSFAVLWRGRRSSVHYLRMLLRRAELANRPWMVAAICRHGTTTADKAIYLRKLAELESADAVNAASQSGSTPIEAA